MLAFEGKGGKVPKILMMYGGLVLTILVFTAIALYFVTRPNFQVKGLEEPAEQEQAPQS